MIQSNDTFSEALPLYDHGLLGEGEIIGHIDSSPGLTHCFFLDPAVAEAGPTHRKVVSFETTSGPGQHGSHTAGTACGENWDLAFPGNRGMAPKARLAHINLAMVGGDASSPPTPSNLFTLLGANHEVGARIHTNSWGNDGSTSYTDWCVDIDSFSRFREDDLVVFACTNTLNLRSPENAKNCLSVGASFGPDLQDSISAGGAGPTFDGRRKPEVYAPGRSVVSANTAECFLFTLSGTSMASPAVAGGAALVREYFRRGFYPTGRAWPGNARTPSGALLKAAVINSTVDMTREPGYPGLREGWGRILLDDVLFFDGDSRHLWLRDVRHDNGLETAGTLQWAITVLSSAEPLAVTMAFMDEPGTHLAAEAAVNDLDLEVSGPDGLFLGNFFDTGAGVSLPNGDKDLRNNVERVIVAAPTPGVWTVRVRGASVPMGPQGFAVVANGAFPSRVQVGQVAPDLWNDPPPESPGPPVTPAWALDPARPSPFRGSTDIPFVVPRSARVTLRVYDVSGRIVRVLLDGAVDAGEHVATWDGRTDAGAPAGPGIYLLRLTAPGVERTIRTVLLR
ncbi:S8 family serine peptidase [bacterium]|nr:S8 family serine peptidase [bacterium]